MFFDYFTLICVFFIFPAFVPLIHPATIQKYVTECVLNRLSLSHIAHYVTHQFDKWSVNVIGWLNSVTGMVRTYLKSRFNTDPSTSKENDKMKSLATVSPMRSSIATNPFAQSPPHMTAMKTPSHAVQNMYERHRSPDPPPRNTRGNQSPLILRRKLEIASSSPLMQKR